MANVPVFYRKVKFAAATEAFGIHEEKNLCSWLLEVIIKSPEVWDCPKPATLQNSYLCNSTFYIIEFYRWLSICTLPKWSVSMFLNKAFTEFPFFGEFLKTSLSSFWFGLKSKKDSFLQDSFPMGNSIFQCSSWVTGQLGDAPDNSKPSPSWQKTNWRGDISLFCYRFAGHFYFELIVQYCVTFKNAPQSFV